MQAQGGNGSAAVERDAVDGEAGNGGGEGEVGGVRAALVGGAGEGDGDRRLAEVALVQRGGAAGGNGCGLGEDGDADEQRRQRQKPTHTRRESTSHRHAGLLRDFSGGGGGVWNSRRLKTPRAQFFVNSIACLPQSTLSPVLPRRARRRLFHNRRSAHASTSTRAMGLRESASTTPRRWPRAAPVEREGKTVPIDVKPAPKTRARRPASPGASPSVAALVCDWRNY